MKNEIWKDAKGYVGYQVSNQGNVRSFLRGGKYNGIILTPFLHKRRVVVSMTKNNKTRHVDLARLVCETFIPCNKKDLHIEHKDGDLFNNAVDNLEWSKKTMKEYMGETMSIINRKGLNEYTEKNGVVTVKLRNSDKEMICDIDDWERLKCFTWFDCNGYTVAARNKKFHRMVMNPPKDKVIDHINRNTYDNRKCNLRITTSLGNSLNTSVQKDNQLGVLGVHKNTGTNGRYFACIKLNGKTIRLGTYNTIEEAEQARKEGEKKYFYPIIERETYKE